MLGLHDALWWSARVTSRVFTCVLHDARDVLLVALESVDAVGHEWEENQHEHLERVVFLEVRRDGGACLEQNREQTVWVYY